MRLLYNLHFFSLLKNCKFFLLLNRLLFRELLGSQQNRTEGTKTPHISPAPCTCTASFAVNIPNQSGPLVIMNLHWNQGLPRWHSGKESAYQFRRCQSSVPGWGSPGGGNGNPLQYSCLKISMDRGAWRVTVYQAAKSRTRLSMKARHCYHYNLVHCTWFSLSAVPSSLQDLRSPTRDRTCAPCSASMES